MYEMRVYIANLGKYVEGQLVGAWFTPPIDFDDMRSKIGLNDYYGEYAIHDYELPFEVDEYTSIEEINYLCGLVEELPEPICSVVEDLIPVYGGLENLVEHADDIIYYSNCDSISDLAYYLIDECSAFGEIPEAIQPYIDYEAYARDLELNSRFVLTSIGIFECPF